MAASQNFTSAAHFHNEKSTRIGKLNRRNPVESSLLQVAENLRRFFVLEDKTNDSSTLNVDKEICSQGLPISKISCNYERFCYANEEKFQVKEATIVKLCSVFDGIQLNEDSNCAGNGSSSNRSTETSLPRTQYTFRWHYPLINPARREKEYKRIRPAGKFRKFLRKIGLKPSKAKTVKRKPKSKINLDQIT